MSFVPGTIVNNTKLAHISATTTNSVSIPVPTMIDNMVLAANGANDDAAFNWRVQYGFSDPAEAVSDPTEAHINESGCFGSRSETNTSNLSLREVVSFSFFLFLCFSLSLSLSLSLFIYIHVW